ncbi:MAG: DUF2760 domain-containing protein [Planctomycetota bacterium]
MSRILWAFRCFFGVLFSGRVPASTPAGLLPHRAEPAAPPAAASGPAPAENKGSAGEKPTGPAAPAVPQPARSTDPTSAREDGVIAILSVFQRDGRLIDFLTESIDDYDDAQVGAAVRAVHEGCAKALREHVPLAPVLKGDEDDPVTVETKFDKQSITLTGNLEGDPPFAGTLRHPGWRAARVTLPSHPAGLRTIQPAEVEL